MTKEDMDTCLEYWRKNVSELGDPVNRKRDVMCEPYCVPWYDCEALYRWFHFRRHIPYKKDDDRTTELQEVYDDYEVECKKQIKDYTEFYGPHRNGTVCRAMSCRRVFGRRGLIFCTEGCCDGPKLLHREEEGGEGSGSNPAPPMAHPDLDDDNDAARILLKVLGDPPPNVVYKRWEKDPETGECRVVTIRAKEKKETETTLEAAAVPHETAAEMVQTMLAPSTANLSRDEGVEATFTA